MSFVSDYAAQRTCDPVTGWSLMTVARPGGAGTESFKLSHPDMPGIDFWGIRTLVERTGATLSSGRPEFRVTFDVQNVDTEPTGTPPPDRMQLIVKALVAYGNVHDGPVGFTRVLFRGAEI